MDDIAFSCLDINPDTVQAVTFPKEELRQVGTMLNETKTVALPPTGHTATAREKELLRECASPDGGGGPVVAGIPASTDAFVSAHAEKTHEGKRRGTLGAPFGRHTRQAGGDGDSNEVYGPEDMLRGHRTGHQPLERRMFPD